MNDSKTAIKYLKDLPIGTIVTLGLDLGLSYDTLRAMTPENIYKEMVVAWLSKKDNVVTTSIPTWKSLIASLKKVNDGSKIIKAIEKGKMKAIMTLRKKVRRDLFELGDGIHFETYLD